MLPFASESVSSGGRSAKAIVTAVVRCTELLELMSRKEIRIGIVLALISWESTTVVDDGRDSLFVETDRECVCV